MRAKRFLRVPPPWPAAVLLLTMISVPCAAVGKSYRALSYQSEARVQQDGSLLINESVRIRFKGGPFTFFYRGIPTSKTDGVRLLAASDSTVLRPRRSRLDVTWRFPAIRDTVLCFTLRYRVLGAVGLAGDEGSLRWTPFPGSRAYPIDTARAALFLSGPETSVTRLKVEPSGTAVRQDPAASAIRVGPMALASERTITLSLGLAAGGVHPPRPAWQAQEDHWRAQLPLDLGLAAFLLAGGCLWVLRLRASLRSRREVRGGTLPRGRADPRSSPPDDLPPPLLGALCRGAVELSDALACIFDLAQRGDLLVETPPRRSWWADRTPVLRLSDPKANPTSYESVLLEAIRAKSKESGSVSWSKVQSEILKRLKRFSREVIAELERRGDFDPGAQDDRKRLYKAALLIFILGCVFLAGAVALAREMGPAILAVPVAGFVAAGMATAAAGTYPLWTANGARRALEWRGFGRFLNESAKGGAPLTAERFHAWLPQAVALGAAGPWLKAGKRQGLRPPPWLITAAGADADLTCLIAAATAVSAASSGGGGAGGTSGAG